ncbi:MAG TPA: hypothetical protein EYG49_02290 [Gammaproteobacteria bacterium]|nr:hypothetical protein [Gammaproteobacteria bacterium]
MCRYRLIYSGKNESRKTPETIELDYEKKDKKRKKGTVLRIVRDTNISRKIKEIYNFKCQVCGTTIKTKSGLYAEGAHIKPLGKPHDGDDSTDNLLCLCPNHHVMFDKGGFSIMDNFEIIGGISGTVDVHQGHKINLENLQYHRVSHGFI